jgi:hypothetical protein
MHTMSSVEWGAEWARIGKWATVIQPSHGNAEENHDMSQSGETLTWERFELRTFQVEV